MDGSAEQLVEAEGTLVPKSIAEVYRLSIQSKSRLARRLSSPRAMP